VSLEHEVDAVLSLITRRSEPGCRAIFGIAGPPGSGKSTLAARVVDALVAQRGADAAALLPMDGYHLENDTLDAHGLRALKGAPQTFDVSGFVDLVRRVRQGDADIRYPLFDRAGDCTLPDAGLLRADTPIVVVEGNYLLLRDGDWSDLAPLFDATVMIAPPLAVLEERLIARWLSHGLPPDAATARARGNDLVNARTVLDQSAPADLVLGVSEAGDTSTR
jgi:pantothenate kinase